MAQLTIYLDDETEQKARAAARSRGLSLSKWIADRVRQGALSDWPDYIRDLAGAWSDLPSAEQLRKPKGRTPDGHASEVFVLDTNTVLDYFKGRGRVAERLLAVAPSEIALPAVSAYEVWVGVLGSQNTKRRREQFEAFLSVVEILPFDAEAAMQAAELRHGLERAGEAIGPLDTLIAATTLSHGGVLVTRNLREFARVPGLKTVNWHD